jgi:lipoyl(octanoyl) transferase
MLHVQKLGRISYRQAWEKQKQLVTAIDQEELSDQLLLLEHDHTITLGRGSHQENLLLSRDEFQQRGIEVIEIDRGGDVTYHGPGQLVCYPLIYLGTQGNAKQYLRKLEEVIIRVLQHLKIDGGRKEAYTGVGIDDQKVAAIGVKFNRARQRKGYITSHGFALNVNTDLSYFQTIIPCGIQEYGVTSMEKLLGRTIAMDKVMEQVIDQMKRIFT